MSTFMSEFEHLRISLEIIKSATNNFSADRFIAEGGYGKVYRGEFSRAEGNTMGAVKRWSLSKGGDPEFRREIMLLSDNKHENLISLIGFCYEDKERIIVYEYAPNISLDFHLKDPELGWIQRLGICVGAARGLEYLHNPKGGQRVLHFDIKSANILLDENLNAKIADFGLSKYGPANQNRSYLITQAKGTLGYTDPIFIETMAYTKECDVYSFGVVLFEVLCSRLCLDSKYDAGNQFLLPLLRKYSKEEIRVNLVGANIRQQMAENSFDMFVTVANQCLEREQEQRPSMELIVKKLETALEYQIVSLQSAADDDIKKWSSGKEGNIQALLLTLHDILGPKSGWMPVSPNKTLAPGHFIHLYKRAVYTCEPDTLQRRGASFQEKYICGEILETLKVPFESFESFFKSYQRPAVGGKYDEVIKSWSSGKEGNLHALLSTLHDILGAESGWKPISVTKNMTTADHVNILYDLARHVLRFSDDIRTSELNRCGKVLTILRVGYICFSSEERDERRLLGYLYDDDIRRWSEGKERDLGYLLSKLQHILGHESGWELVSLDVPGTATFLGNAYRKSLLLTNPQKLIQRGASRKEKYIYGEVRKMLKDVWDCSPAKQKLLDELEEDMIQLACCQRKLHRLKVKN